MPIADRNLWCPQSTSHFHLCGVHHENHSVDSVSKIKLGESWRYSFAMLCMLSQAQALSKAWTWQELRLWSAWRSRGDRLPMQVDDQGLWARLPTTQAAPPYDRARDQFHHPLLEQARTREQPHRSSCLESRSTTWSLGVRYRVRVLDRFSSHLVHLD